MNERGFARAVLGIGSLLALLPGLLPGTSPARGDEAVEVTGELAGECSLRGAGSGREETGRLRSAEDGWIDWAARPGDRIHCTGAFEPLDLAVGDRDDEGSVRFRPLSSRTVRIRGTGDSLPTVVEWRSPSSGTSASLTVFEQPDEHPSILLARREIAWEGRLLDLEVAPEPRWLRFHWPDASPATLVVDPRSEAPELHLPAPSPGGEIFAALEPPAIPPVSFLVEGRGHVEPGPDRTFGLTGLAPGDHTLVPVYRGGVRGSPVPVTVEVGGTTELLPIPLAEVSGVEYVLPFDVCDPLEPVAPLPSRLVVERLTSEHDDPGREVVGRQEASIEEGACSGVVEGLAAGESIVSVHDEEGSLVARTRVTLWAGEVVEARLTSAVARVTGRVTIGEEEPFADARLEFVKRGTRKATVTDARGHYEISLPEAGTYRVILKASRFMPVRGFERRVREGDQEIDLHVEGGILGIEIETLGGSEIEEPIQVEIESETGQATAGFLLPDEGFEQEFPGLDFGAYQVRAFSPSGWNTEAPVEVTLGEEEPYRRVTLLLRRTESLLRLVDPVGQRVSGASVQVGMRLPEETAPGVFELTGAAPGQRLEIRAPGFAPVCRILGRSTDLTVTLRPAGGEALIVFPEGVAPYGSVIGVPDSTCPVRDDLLDGTVTRAERGSALTLRGLPEGEYVFTQGDERSVRFTVPGPPAVLGRAGVATEGVEPP